MRAEQQKKQRAFTDFNGGIMSRKRGQGDEWKSAVQAWAANAEKVAQSGGLTRPEDVTRKWEYQARAGSSRVQLQDYASLLHESICSREAALQALQDEVALRMEGLQSGDASPISPA